MRKRRGLALPGAAFFHGLFHVLDRHRLMEDILQDPIHDRGIASGQKTSGKTVGDRDYSLSILIGNNRCIFEPGVKSTAAIDFFPEAAMELIIDEV